MRDRDLDLIAALAEGSLEDETEARALLESSDDARLEYESQKTALAALADTPSAKMTDSEKTTLHRDLWTDLRSNPASKSSRTPWYYRWAPVAASLFVVVGIAAVISQSSSDGTSETFAEIGSSLDGGSDGASVVTNPAGGGESAPAADEASVEFYTKMAADLRSDITSEDSAESPSGDLYSANRAISCLQEAGLVGYEVVSSFEEPTKLTDAPSDIVPFLVAVPEGESLSTAPLVFVDIDTCQQIHIEE